MTAANGPTNACPNCASSNTTIGGSGSAMCLDCATMWDPTETPAPPPPVIEPFGMEPVDEVYGESPGPLTPAAAAIADEYTRAHPDEIRLHVADHPDSDEMVDVTAWLDASGNPDTYADRQAMMHGGVATLEGGQTGEVVTFSPHDSVVVRTPSGDLLEVPLGDVLRIMPAIVIPDPVAVPDDVDGASPDMLLALQLAQTIIRAGCESVHGSGENVTPGVPPVGYLPAEPELHAVVERSAGLAVGMLIEVFELDVDAILEWVGAVTESEPE